jgi:hypothetical protein
MRGVFNASASRVLGGLGGRLANGRLHLIGIGLGQYAIEIQVHCRLIHAIKILQVSERGQPIVAKAIGLIVGQLRRSA